MKYELVELPLEVKVKWLVLPVWVMKLWFPVPGL